MRHDCLTARKIATSQEHPLAHIILLNFGLKTVIKI